ncbi:MAG: hypothetical protein J5856_08695 [Lachnospiraceae bacterium]|nr:hypothetical protein [Lachnospiraceae bacterium]
MLYCVRCGDKIDKDELVCDKCGLRFTIERADGTTVYINRAPRPLNETVNNSKTKKKKRKKFPYGLIIALVSVTSLALALFTGIFLLGSGLILGLAMSVGDDDSPEVVVNNPEQNSTPAPVIYQNEHFMESELVSNAIREPFVTLKGDGTDTVTVMIYMNGSDLESKYGYATEDLSEMLNASLSDNVNVVIQTGGTKKWKTEGISNKHSQRFIVKNNKLELVDDSLGQLDITEESTLLDFINYCSTNYPANRNILIFWDHGGGVVYGYGVDENVEDIYAALTIDEIQRAVRDSGVKFEMIGFDSCLMGGLETACVLCDVSDYLVVSEDFESGSGWEYQNWLSILGYNSSTPMPAVAKVIIDDFIRESLSCDCEGVLALVDLRYTRLLYSAWTDFAYSNEDELLSFDYTMSMEKSDRAPDRIFGRYVQKDIWDMFYEESYTMESYCYAVDIMALASTMNTKESNALNSVMKSSIIYCSSTAGDSYMTGLSVTLPYGDSEFFDELNTVFSRCGFDQKYIDFLSKFADTVGVSSYDWESSDFSGWESYDSTYDDFDWDDFDWDSFYDYYGIGRYDDGYSSYDIIYDDCEWFDYGSDYYDYDYDYDYDYGYDYEDDCDDDCY